LSSVIAAKLAAIILVVD